MGDDLIRKIIFLEILDCWVSSYKWSKVYIALWRVWYDFLTRFLLIFLIKILVENFVSNSVGNKFRFPNWSEILD